MSTAIAMFKLRRHDHGQPAAEPWSGAVAGADDDDIHPLVQVRLQVDALGEGGNRLLRAALLQALYSLPGAGQLLEQLRYNALYRWFVGLHGQEQPWTESSYAGALAAMFEEPVAAERLRQALLAAAACAARSPGRFRVDCALIERWTATLVPVREPLEPPPGGRLARARAVILRRLADPTLDADAIAGELGMSRRALYLMFERHGQTPSRAVRQLRLESCLRLLGDGRHDHRKLSDIAWDHGFNDYATFSRLFKARYGMAPNALRQRHRGADRREA